MNLKNYETVFILTPVLSEQQTKDTVDKFKKLLTNNGSKIVNEESWGLRKLAYPILGKQTGFYQIFEFSADPAFISKLEIEYKRDERVIRFLTTALDKHAVAYNEKRRKGAVGKKKEKTEKVEEAAEAAPSAEKTENKEA